MREKDIDESVAIGRYGDLPIGEDDVIVADVDGYEYPVNRSLFEASIARVNENVTLVTESKEEQ